MALDSFYLTLHHCLKYKRQFCIKNQGLFLNHSIHFYTICLSYTFALAVLFYSLFFLTSFDLQIGISGWLDWLSQVWKDWGLRYGIVGELLFRSSWKKNQRSEIGFGNSRICRAGSNIEVGLGPCWRHSRASCHFGLYPLDTRGTSGRGDMARWIFSSAQARPSKYIC
jgi:hypothetical protein